MNREIEFRGQRSDNGEWVTGDLVTVRSEGGKLQFFIAGNGAPLRVRSETVGQFTGLLDKNGKQIFEGDVVKRIFVNEHLQEVERLWEVYWGQWCWMKKKGNGILFSFDSIEARGSEIIGNIHDNPELLSERSGVLGRK